MILALTLPVTPLLSWVPNLPQLFAHFASVPNHDYWVPKIITMPMDDLHKILGAQVCVAIAETIIMTTGNLISHTRGVDLQGTLV